MWAPYVPATNGFNNTSQSIWGKHIYNYATATHTHTNTNTHTHTKLLQTSSPPSDLPDTASSRAFFSQYFACNPRCHDANAERARSTFLHWIYFLNRYTIVGFVCLLCSNKIPKYTRPHTRTHTRAHPHPHTHTYIHAHTFCCFFLPRASF